MEIVTGMRKKQGAGPKLKDFSQIRLDGKRPIDQNWQRNCHEHRVLSEGEINGHNIGIACGPASGCIVLDIDDPEAFKATCKKNGWTVPDTYTVQTGSGKPHYYFQYPQDGEKYGNKSYPSMGFDTRGLGGQVVAPGSIHPDTGTITSILPLFGTVFQILLTPGGFVL